MAKKIPKIEVKELAKRWKSRTWLEKLFLFLLLSSVLTKNCFAQSSPVIYSFKQEMDVRFNGLLAKQKFTLLPQNRPDLLTLDPKFSIRDVSFITDVDSINIQLDGHSERDLTVILNGKDSCFIKITYKKEEYFTSTSYGYILTMFSISFLLGYALFSRRIPLRLQLSSGWISAVLFWVALFAGGLLQNGYDHINMRISDLGNMGSGSEFLFSISILLVDLLIFCFSFTLLTNKVNLRINFFCFSLLLLTPVSFFLPKLFPLNMLFNVDGGPVILHVLIVQLVSLKTWLRSQERNLVRTYTWVSIAFICLGIIHNIPPISAWAPGLFQRFFHVGWSLWILVVSLYLLRQLRTK